MHELLINVLLKMQLVSPDIFKCCHLSAHPNRFMTLEIIQRDGTTLCVQAPSTEVAVQELAVSSQEVSEIV